MNEHAMTTEQIKREMQIMLLKIWLKANDFQNRSLKLEYSKANLPARV